MASTKEKAQCFCGFTKQCWQLQLNAIVEKNIGEPSRLNVSKTDTTNMKTLVALVTAKERADQVKVIMLVSRITKLRMYVRKNF